MAWYSAGTVTVTSGSAIVTGAGTDFVSNVAARDGFALIGGNVNEIASIQSATQLTLARPWFGASSSGQAYTILPTVGIYVDLGLRALNMLGPFQALLDGIGQGLVGDGSAATPGVRFLADQDTGFRRIGANIMGLVTGGADRLVIDAAGCVSNVTAGSGVTTHNFTVASGAWRLSSLNGADAGEDGTVKARLALMFNGATENAAVCFLRGGDGVVGQMALNTSGSERVRIDGAGNMLVGATSGFNHRIARGDGLATGGIILGVGFPTIGDVATFYAARGGAASGAAAAMKINANETTGRSINAGGTINASGADYAEYMAKAPHCGTIEKGDVCGVDRDGRLTRTWADAVRYVVKSTDPNLVGGDIWSAHLGPRPDAPGAAPMVPVAPSATAGGVPAEPVREEDEGDIDFIRRMATYLVAASAAAQAASTDAEALAAYQADLATYPARKAAHDAAVAAYNAALAAWEAALEDARLGVDRIAFAGQVPVNVDADTLSACEAALANGEAVYLVAVARGAGIAAAAVREAAMTLPSYMRRLGAVWAVRDGRPWIDVQHG